MNPEPVTTPAPISPDTSTDSEPQAHTHRPLTWRGSLTFGSSSPRASSEEVGTWRGSPVSKPTRPARCQEGDRRLEGRLATRSSPPTSAGGARGRDLTRSSLSPPPQRRTRRVSAPRRRRRPAPVPPCGPCRPPRGRGLPPPTSPDRRRAPPERRPPRPPG
jgi:hypothetical protein